MRVAATSVLAVVATTVLSAPHLTHAHPGAVADGRATCGTEYATSASAYTIPDIREAWYLRRIATCAEPVFWSRFDIVKDREQKVYIAVISPEIDRFEDELTFHAIWYGPGLDPDGGAGLSAVPTTLPEGVELDEEKAKMGAGYMTSPARFDSCDFVDTNPVMKKFSDVIDGRCMENFSFSKNFTDTLQQDASNVRSWWLYSYNHLAADPGTYYLQTWLTSRDDPTKTAQGKYEITLGPHGWSGYASDSTLNLAQSQGTSCACAVNAWDYKETKLERLGDLPIEFEEAQLPGGSCSADEAPASPCATIPQEQYMTDGSAVEWSGLFDLKPGKTYEWTFRSYYQGAEAEEYGYPDPGMFVYLTPSSEVVSVAKEANDILTSTVEEEEEAPSSVVAEGETVTLDKVHFIEFNDPAEVKSTTVLIQPDVGAASIAMFTQHVPSEFMAHALREVESGEYVFPTTPTLYVDKSGPVIDPDNCAADGERSQSCGATNPERPPTCCEGYVCQLGNGVKCVPAPPTTEPVEAAATLESELTVEDIKPKQSVETSPGGHLLATDSEEEEVAATASPTKSPTKVPTEAAEVATVETFVEKKDAEEDDHDHAEDDGHDEDIMMKEDDDLSSGFSVSGGMTAILSACIVVAAVFF